MSLVEVTQHGSVAVVSLNDPDRRNAMTVAMGEAMREAFEGICPRVAILTGAPPAFSAGGDLDMLERLGRRTREEQFDATAEMRAFYERFLVVRRVPYPVIAAVNGHAVGAGACVALACDLRIVADRAKIGLSFARLGLHPGMGGTWFLPRAVGPQRAAELLYTGRLARGDELVQYGLALEAAPADEVLPKALALAESIASSSPVVVRQLKQSLAGSEHRTLDEQLELEARCQAVNYGTTDLVEGLEAVRARRAPTFDD